MVEATPEEAAVDATAGGVTLERLQAPVSIGGLRLPNRAILAPLAGVTDIPFRRLCNDMGAGYAFVEMLSATAIRYRARRTLEMMRRHDKEARLGVQLTGGSAGEIAEAIAFLDTQGFDSIDINMGCPVRKIVRKGWGSALLLNPAGVREIVERAREATRLPLSVKIRVGYDADCINVAETAACIAEAGAVMLTIHGRTRNERYGAPVRYDCIAEGFRQARKAARPPVCVGNGNVLDRPSALQMLHETHCDAVMISRGVLGNPWIFRELLGTRPHNPTLQEWLEGVLQHLAYHREHYGDNRMAAVVARKHLIWYMRGFRGSRAMREKLSVVESLDDARDLFRRFASEHPPDAVRFEAEQAPAHDEDPSAAMDREHDRPLADDHEPDR